MKAEELMIGDWARVNHDGLCIKKDTIVVIGGIDADNSLAGRGLIGSAHCRPLDDDQFEGGVWCEYLEPIPLTAGILEKNGFTHYGESWYLPDEEYVMVGFHMYNTIIHVKKGINCFHWEIPCGYRSSNSIRYAYVHELQHALRLCGIEKEITI